MGGCLVRDAPHEDRALVPGPPPIPVSLLIVERYARGMQRRGGVLAAIGQVGVPATMIAQLAPGAASWALAAILWTIVACVGLRGFFVGRGVLARIDQPAVAVTAVLQGSTLLLRGGGDEETLLGVWPSTIARLRDHAVPTSIARST